MNSNTAITLVGHEGFDEIILAKTYCDKNGQFELNYSKNYIGAAKLQIDDSSSLMLSLNNENFAIEWSDIKNFETVSFSNSPENKSFEEGMKIYQDVKNKLVGLKFLLPLYTNEKSKWIQNEISFQENLFDAFLKKLPKKSYASYFLKAKKLTLEMALATSQPQNISIQENEFLKLDFDNNYLWNSGLYKELMNTFSI